MQTEPNTLELLQAETAVVDVQETAQPIEIATSSPHEALNGVARRTETVSETSVNGVAETGAPIQPAEAGQAVAELTEAIERDLLDEAETLPATWMTATELLEPVEESTAPVAPVDAPPQPSEPEPLTQGLRVGLRAGLSR